MDTTGDGIVDDFLAVKKKRGRKSLGLTPDEMKAHREVLRKMRVAKKKEEEKRNAVRAFIFVLESLRKQGFSLSDIAEEFVARPNFEIKFNEHATMLSGVEGGRLKRRNAQRKLV